MDTTKLLDNQQLEKLKEKYPIQQIIPEDEETTDIEGMKDMIDEINPDLGTLERGKQDTLAIEKLLAFIL